MVCDITRRTILALDGHDGSGKSVLAKRIANHLGAVYVRPFSGTAGEIMLSSAEKEDFDFTSCLGRKLVDHALAVNDGPVLIFDRLWMTVFTLIREENWREWKSLPPTILCWADIETTLSRLQERKEGSHDVNYHLTYMHKYQTLAQRFSCPILRTDQLSIEACVEQLVEWATSFI